MTESRPPKVLAIIPVRQFDIEKTGGMPVLGGRPLIAYTIESAKRAGLIDRLIISTDSEDVRRLAIELDAEVPFLRPPELAAAGTPMERVLEHALSWLEAEARYRPDIIVKLEISHPFRDEGLIDRVIQTLIDQQLDAVFTAYEERHSFWKVGPGGELEAVTEERRTRNGRSPLYKEVSGIVWAAWADRVRAKDELGHRVGLVPLTSMYALVDTQDELGLELASRLMASGERPEDRTL